MNPSPAPGPPVHLWAEPSLAGHEAIEVWRQRMARPGAPHHLAKCNRGVYEFEVDVLDDEAALDQAAGASPERRALYRATEQQLAFMMTALDRELSRAETGRLIRMVLHAERGALFAMAVTPMNYVLAIVFGAAGPLPGEPPRSLPRVPLVRNADTFTSGLAEELRDRIGLPPTNLGGWLSAALRLRASRTGEPVPAEGRGPATRRWGARPAVVDRLCALLDPTELIYLAVCREGRVTGEADLFDHPVVYRGRPPGELPQQARHYYRRLAEECALYARQLGQIAGQAMPGRLLRIVLDVEQGAVYHYRLSPSEYLVGVTINQKKVSESDDELGDFVAELSGETPLTER
ncbi:hypothetical protein [Actinomadura fibrosa]|uniref:Uncharacterized protein n=1 Tax=Actinomadura fibrosa TaxID=111802 RepID=A0ABW2XSD8_9ACTN|nr:hypothetical protein [Actinomadura fibrosa]